MAATAIRKKWTHTFIWTPDHLSRSTIDPLRHEYDRLGAAALAKLQEISVQQGNSGSGDAPCPKPRLDLYAVLRDHHHTDATLNQFWEELHTTPEWVDWEQIRRGQEFFYRYAVANLMGFALQGFIGETASPGVGEVLVRTGGWSTQVLLHRLLESFQWVCQINNSLPSIQPGGEGHISTVRVRLLHAAVRQRITKLAQFKPAYYDMGKYGVPVNTLDSIHSLTTFCVNPPVLQLPKMGIYPTQREVDDYVALFRYIAHIIGCPTEYFSTSGKARGAMESMYLHEFKVTKTSGIVGHNFVKCLENLPRPLNFSKEFLEAGSRWFNGDEFCDELGMGRPGWYHYVLMMGLVGIVMMLSFLQRIFPLLDRFMIKYSREKLYDVIIMRGLGEHSVFDFKYLPQLGMSTGKELPSEKQKASGPRSPSRPAEQFLLICFLVSVAVIAGTLYCTIKTFLFAGGALRDLL